MEAKELIGKRVEIPVHYDMWMRGARTGIVTSAQQGKNGYSAFVRVKLDNNHTKKLLKVWRLDWEYMKVL